MKDIIIKSPLFLGSFDNYKKCPSSKLREYAFIGRSNVGKSSLINMLCQKKGLAKVSGTPGKTKLLNLFNVDEQFILTDLPGYGFARASKADKEKWQKFILDYLINRENLHCLFILIDVRLEPQKIDLEFIDWVGIQGIPFVLVFTKGDKVGKTEQQSSIARFKRAMLKTWDELPPVFATSSETKEGRSDLLKFMLES
jgi:GTP-binding protein